MFKKAFSILELEERKDRRVVKQDFHGNYQVNVIYIYIYIFLFCFVFCFFCLFLRLCSFWYGLKALHPAKVNGQSW